jgi:uncharacterized caspase-like protein
LIANHKYEASVGELKNPKNDVDEIATALQTIGFPKKNIFIEPNLRADELRNAIREHVARVKAAGPGTISFFYYAGHGAAAPEAQGNYIIPIDVPRIDRPDVWRQAIALDEVIKSLAAANEAKHVVVFDACRDELNVPTRGMQLLSFTPIPLTQQDAEMLIAFATAPGRRAWDAHRPGERNGPYAVALSGELKKGGLNHMELFYNVRMSVRNMTASQQVPWTHDGLLTRLTLNSTPAPPREPNQNTCDRRDTAVTAEPIVWTEVPGKSRVRFKTYGYTYEQPIATANLIEEVNEGSVHHVANGTTIQAGATLGGEVAWYRYQRSAGSARTRYVMAREAELR